MDVIIYSASVSSRAFIFLDSCLAAVNALLGAALHLIVRGPVMASTRFLLLQVEFRKESRGVRAQMKPE